MLPRDSLSAAQKLLDPPSDISECPESDQDGIDDDDSFRDVGFRIGIFGPLFESFVNVDPAEGEDEDSESDVELCGNKRVS